MKRHFAAGVVFLLAATVALNADTKVDCAKGESINAALSKLKKTEPNVVKVTGTCAEDIAIEGFNDLRLTADGPAILTPATPSSRRVLLVNSSLRVAIDGFTVNIGTAPVLVAEFNGSSGCAMSNMTVNGGGGVRLQRFSNAAITDLAFHNAFIGIIVGNTCQADIRGVTIEFTPPGTGSVGIAVFSGSSAFAEGTSISGYNQGVLASGEFFVPGLGLFDTARPVVIEHNRIGVSGNSGGFVQFSAPTQVKNNGNGSDLTGGVVINGGFLGVSANVPALGSIEISDNNGQGVLLMNNGTSNIVGSAAFVTNNHLNGVAVVNGAVGSFGNAANVTGNGAKDLFSDDRSLVTGSAAVVGATKVQCTNLLPGALPPMPHPAP